MPFFDVFGDTESRADGAHFYRLRTSSKSPKAFRDKHVAPDPCQLHATCQLPLHALAMLMGEVWWTCPLVRGTRDEA